MVYVILEEFVKGTEMMEVCENVKGKRISIGDNS